jgi:hypothetical protein
MSGPEVTIEAPKRRRKPFRIKDGKVTFLEMTKTCARDLTDRIKSAVDDVAEMLHRAHQERAWAALEYSSWKSYCEAEFQMSKQRSFQLLDFVEIKRTIQESTTVDRVIPQSERQVRPLTQLEPEQQPVAWDRAVEIAEGLQPTSKQVEQAVTEVSPPEKSYEDRYREKIMRRIREEVDEAISVVMTVAWERVKKSNAAIEWPHFLLGVNRWLDRAKTEGTEQNQK